MQQLGAGITPALAGADENVAATQTVLKTFQHAQRVGAAIDLVVRSDDQAPPSTWEKVERGSAQIGLVRGGRAEGFQGTEDGLTSLRALKGDLPQQGRQKAAYPAITPHEFLVVVVLRRSGEGLDQGHRFPETRLGDAREYRGSDLPIDTRFVEKDGARLAQLQGGGIQVAERAEPLLLPEVSGLSGDVRDQEVQQVQGIVLSRGLEGPGERQQRGDSPVAGHAHDGLGASGGGVTGHGLQPSRRDAGQRQFTDPQGTDLREPIQSCDQCRTAHPSGSAAKSVPWALARPLGDEQQGLQPRALRGVRRCDQHTPQPGRRAVSHNGNQPRQDRHAREQDLALDQTGRGQVEQQARLLDAQPGTHVEPADQAEVPRLVAEILVPIVPLDFQDVFVTRGPALHVARQTCRVGNTKLSPQVRHHPGRHVDRVVQEGPQEAHGTDLKGEAESVVVSTTGR